MARSSCEVSYFYSQFHWSHFICVLYKMVSIFRKKKLNMLVPTLQQNCIIPGKGAKVNTITFSKHLAVVYFNMF